MLTKAAQNWYGDYSRKDEDCYYFYGGEVCVCTGHYKEIANATYNEIAGYVTEVSAI